MPPGVPCPGEVLERPVASQHRPMLTVARAAVAVLLSGHTETHVQSVRRNRRRSECGVFKGAEWSYVVAGIYSAQTLAQQPEQRCCSREHV